MKQTAEITYEGVADASFGDCVETQAILRVTGYSIDAAVSKVLVVAQQQECEREDCEITVNVCEDSQVVGFKPIISGNDRAQVVPLATIEMSCETKDCSSFFKCAARIEDLGSTCMQAVKVVDGEVARKLQIARDEANAAFSASLEESRQIVTSAQVRADAILTKAQVLSAEQ